MRNAVERLLPKGERLRALVDVEDVVQEPWKSVLEALRRGLTLATADDFGRYVVRVAENQVAREYRDHVRCLKRSLKRQQQLDGLNHDGPLAEADPAEAEWGHRRLKKGWGPRNVQIGAREACSRWQTGRGSMRSLRG
jgi:DNA-directed RNA polymerase specialized sigma24 family protein